MTPRIIKIQYKENYIYKVKFEDNKEGYVDFKPYIWGEAFEKLKEQNVFRKAFIDDISGTISWTNGPDIAPETLYQKVISHKSTLPANSL